jgi:hypothetical protein
MPFVNQALDHFNESLGLAESLNDMALKAESMANLGDIYLRVLKNEDKARYLLNFPVTLVLSNLHKHLKNEDWYKTAKKNLGKLDGKHKEDFDKNNPAEFIKYIQRYLKPENWTTEVTEEDLKPEKIQRTIAKVVRFYHPDSS